MAGFVGGEERFKTRGSRDEEDAFGTSSSLGNGRFYQRGEWNKKVQEGWVAQQM